MALAGVFVLPVVASVLALWIAVPIRRSTADVTTRRVATIAAALGIVGILEGALFLSLIVS